MTKIGVVNCPHCDTPIREHEMTECLNAWVHEVVMGKPTEWVEEQDETITFQMANSEEESVSVNTIPGYFFDRTDLTQYIHSSDGFTGMIPLYSMWIAAAQSVLLKVSQEWAIGIFHVPSISSVMFGWRVHLIKSVYPPDRTGEDELVGAADKDSELPLAICRAAITASLSE